MARVWFLVFLSIAALPLVGCGPSISSFPSVTTAGVTAAQTSSLRQSPEGALYFAEKSDAPLLVALGESGQINGLLAHDPETSRIWRLTSSHFAQGEEHYMELAALPEGAGGLSLAEIATEGARPLGAELRMGIYGILRAPSDWVGLEDGEGHLTSFFEGAVHVGQGGALTPIWGNLPETGLLVELGHGIGHIPRHVAVRGARAGEFIAELETLLAASGASLDGLEVLEVEGRAEEALARSGADLLLEVSEELRVLWSMEARLDLDALDPLEGFSGDLSQQVAVAAGVILGDARRSSLAVLLAGDWEEGAGARALRAGYSEHAAMALQARFDGTQVAQRLLESAKTGGCDEALVAALKKEVERALFRGDEAHAAELLASLARSPGCATAEESLELWRGAAERFEESGELARASLAYFEAYERETISSDAAGQAEDLSKACGLASASDASVLKARCQGWRALGSESAEAASEALAELPSWSALSAFYAGGQARIERLSGRHLQALASWREVLERSRVGAPALGVVAARRILAIEREGMAGGAKWRRTLGAATGVERLRQEHPELLDAADFDAIQGELCEASIRPAGDAYAATREESYGCMQMLRRATVQGDAALALQQTKVSAGVIDGLHELRSAEALGLAREVSSILLRWYPQDDEGKDAKVAAFAALSSPLAEATVGTSLAGSMDLEPIFSTIEGEEKRAGWAEVTLALADLYYQEARYKDAEEHYLLVRGREEVSLELRAVARLGTARVALAYDEFAVALPLLEGLLREEGLSPTLLVEVEEALLKAKAEQTSLEGKK